MASEIIWRKKTINLKSFDIYGGTLGVFSRKVELLTKGNEMMVIADKQ